MNTNQTLEALMAQLSSHARMQFGNAIKGHWFHESQRCPGCRRPVDAGQDGGTQTLTLNAFIYRERGVLIGYLLCTRCAHKIKRVAQKRPGIQMPLHGQIERTLTQAFQEHISSMDARVAKITVNAEFGALV
jgi:hypothetical protein